MPAYLTPLPTKSPRISACASISVLSIPAPSIASKNFLAAIPDAAKFPSIWFKMTAAKQPWTPAERCKPIANWLSASAKFAAVIPWRWSNAAERDEDQRVSTKDTGSDKSEAKPLTKAEARKVRTPKERRERLKKLKVLKEARRAKREAAAPKIAPPKPPLAP